MAAHVEITLDTTAPGVIFGLPSQILTRVAVPFLLDDPQGVVVEAWLHDEDGRDIPAAIEGGVELAFYGTVADGPALVRVLVQDDLHNAAWREYEFTIGPLLGSISASTRTSDTMRVTMFIPVIEGEHSEAVSLSLHLAALAIIEARGDQGGTLIVSQEAVDG